MIRVEDLMLWARMRADDGEAWGHVWSDARQSWVPRGPEPRRVRGLRLRSLLRI